MELILGMSPTTHSQLRVLMPFGFRLQNFLTLLTVNQEKGESYQVGGGIMQYIKQA